MITGHAFIQNLRRGHDELAIEARSALRIAAAFTELAQAIWHTASAELSASPDLATQQGPSAPPILP